MSRRRLVVLTIVLVTVVLALVEAFRSVRVPAASSAVHGAVEAALSDAQFRRLLELHTGTHLESGNRVGLLLNGDGTFPRLWRDLASARSTITMQMYYAKPGRVSDTLASILCDRVENGVRVLLVLDAFGSVKTKRSWREGLRACGVETVLLRELRWYSLHSATDRSHVRAVVIDGRIGYTGGFGLADYWLGDGRHDDQWRESNVRFEGPAVAGLQAAFAAAWAEATGELIGGPSFFLIDDRAPIDSNGVDAGVLFTAPTSGSTPAERFLALAIRGARSRLYITNSYFVPNAAFRRLLADAADRGVDVRVLTASVKTDVKTPWLAGRSSVFFDDLRASKEMTPAILERRPRWQRLLERAAMMLSYVL